MGIPITGFAIFFVAQLSSVLQNVLCGYETVFIAATHRVVISGAYPHGGVSDIPPFVQIELSK